MHDVHGKAMHGKAMHAHQHHVLCTRDLEVQLMSMPLDPTPAWRNAQQLACSMPVKVVLHYDIVTGPSQSVASTCTQLLSVACQLLCMGQYLQVWMKAGMKGCSCVCGTLGLHALRMAVCRNIRTLR